MELSLEATTLICKICFALSLCSLFWMMYEHRKAMNERERLLRQVTRKNEQLKKYLKI